MFTGICYIPPLGHSEVGPSSYSNPSSVGNAPDFLTVVLAVLALVPAGPLYCLSPP